MRRTALVFTISFFVLSSFAQQLPQQSQYYLNPYSINPAATGIMDMVPLAFTFRKSYAGFEGSPSLQFLSGNMEVYDNMGAGVKFFNYTIGPERKSGAELSYSYHIALENEMYISLGLSGLFYQYYLDRTQFNLKDVEDPAGLETDSKMIIDASFGTYFYGPDFYVGIAVPQLVNRNIDPSDELLQQKQVRHYYLHGGYSYEANTDFTLEPSVLLKFVEAGIFQADINLRAIYQDMFSLGVAYRTNDAFIVHLGLKYEQLQFGYAIDFVLNDIKAASFASHEVTVLYNLDNFFR